MAKKKPVYRLFCTYEHDHRACQEALMILRSIKLPEDVQQCESSTGETPKKEGGCNDDEHGNENL